VKRAAVLLLLVLAVRPAVTAEPLLLPALGGAQPRLDRLLLLDEATAGRRIIAVGERGRILLSDDDGHTWRFARSPTETTLASVFFIDENSFAEPESFWVGGARETRVVLQPDQQRLVRITRKDVSVFSEEDLGNVRFVPLVGEQGWPSV